MHWQVSLQSAAAVPLVLLLMGIAGCDRRPQAPALSDDPVYNNRAAGLRFLVPEGWLQSASSALPPGTLTTEVLLVQYRMPTSTKGATLDVLVFDERQPTDLKDYHQQPSQAVENWSLESDEQLTINDAPARRLVFSGTAANQPMKKEVAVFQRGKRVYSFVGLFPQEDLNAQEQLRRAVASVIWNR